MTTSYLVFRTRLGWCAVSGHERGVQRVVLPGQSREEVLAAVTEGMAGTPIESKHGFTSVAEELEAYFAGNAVSFSADLDFTGAGAFDRSVWQAARTIGYGGLAAYSDLARQVGSPLAARAVGRSLGRNPLPVIVPCHRVVRSDGGMGGFSAGFDWKVRLLSLEGLDLSAEGVGV